MSVLTGGRRGKARTVCGIEFPTVDALKKYIMAIRARATPGVPLAPDDETFMREILKGHPNYKEKVGAGIVCLYVYEIPNSGGQRRFEVLRADGSPRDVAWKKCVAPPNCERDLERVLRRLIKEQMLAFRAGRYESGEGWHCEICGALVIFSGETAVDHIHPWTFKRLCADWYDLVGLAPEEIEVVADPGYMKESRLKDPALTERWLDYHQLNAKMRVLCNPCHYRVHGKKQEQL